MIDSRAVIDPSAQLAPDVTVGPYAIIGPKVTIGAGTTVGPHAFIKGPTTIGKDNQIYEFACVGEDTQDKKYAGAETYLEIGDNNVFREFCTIHRGTNGTTKIGSRNLFMAYTHIAHDCIVGSDTVFSNNASLAGHVIVDDYVIFGGFAAAYQFCHFGKHCFVSAGTMVVKDVPPFVKVAGYYAEPFGLNSVGLTRHNFSKETQSALKEGYNIIYREGHTVEQAIEKLKLLVPKCAEVQSYIDFLQTATRGIVR